MHSSENVDTDEAVAGDSVIEPQADSFAQIVDIPDLDLALDQADSASENEELYSSVESDDTDVELLTEPSILIDEAVTQFLDFDDEDDDVNEVEGGE